MHEAVKDIWNVTENAKVNGVLGLCHYFIIKIVRTLLESWRAPMITVKKYMKSSRE